MKTKITALFIIVLALAVYSADVILGRISDITFVQGDSNNKIAVFGGAFSPLDIANCELWLDASDNSTVTTNATGNITTWADKSTVGDDALQVGADTTLPLYCSNQQNGLCTVSFDGGDYLGVDYKSTDGQTIFVVALVTTGQAMAGARDSTNTRSYIGATTGDAFRYSIGSDAAGTFGGLWGSAYHEMTCYNDGSDVTVRADGSQVATSTQAGTGANTTQGYYIGALNSAGGALIPFTGNIGEMIIYKRVLTITEMEQVETYLADKWGL